MKMLQCMRCGWADMSLSDADADLKIDSHRVKTQCEGTVRRLEGRH